MQRVKLFATKGFDGTSVRDIAQESGVNLAMISYYFGSKEKLLEAIFNNRILLHNEQLKLVLDDTKMTPMKKVFYLIDLLVDRTFNRPCFHKIMVREQIDLSQKSIFIQGLITESKKKSQELVRAIISEGQAKGVIKKNVDIPLMMATMFGTINQMITTQHFYKQINNLEHMPEEDFQNHLKKKLRVHLKSLFKAILTNEN